VIPPPVFFEARNRLLAEFDVGVFGDKDHALRFGLDGYEWDRLARRPHEWMIRRAHHGDDIAADDRTLEDLPFHHAGGVGAELTDASSGGARVSLSAFVASAFRIVTRSPMPTSAF